MPRERRRDEMRRRSERRVDLLTRQSLDLTSRILQQSLEINQIIREREMILREPRGEEPIQSSRTTIPSNDIRVRGFEDIHQEIHRMRALARQRKRRRNRDERTRLTEEMRREARELMGAFDTVKVSVVHINEAPVCVICLTEYNVGENASQMPCHRNHIFHPDCLLQWLERKKNCPLCKTLVSYPYHQPFSPPP
ncbi:hypothetical protein SUGI_0687650 [Cryptomeria japonica]|nr:hypothetical protein SUGI_0687650 [Cryptomeria japonica]